MMIDVFKASQKYFDLLEEINNNYSLNKVKVIFVSKYFEKEVLLKLYQLGIHIFGENRITSLNEKTKLLNKTDIEWHFIGHLQRNKVKKLANINLLHSVENIKLIKELEKNGKNNNLIYNILLELNTGGEDSKYGIRDECELENYFLEIENSPHVNGRGFMTMAPFTDNVDIIRKCFKKLRILKDKYSKYGYKELSMGMSNDFRIALDEGATILRIGSYFFK